MKFTTDLRKATARFSTSSPPRSFSASQQRQNEWMAKAWQQISATALQQKSDCQKHSKKSFYVRSITSALPILWLWTAIDFGAAVNTMWRNWVKFTLAVMPWLFSA